MKKIPPLEYIQRNIYLIAWIVLIFSVVISIFVRSPFGFYDEHVHYIRAVGVGNKQLLSYSEDNSNKLGHSIDSSNKGYVDRYIGNNVDPISLKWLEEDSGGMKKAHKNVYVVNTSAAPYTPLPYLPYIPGLKIAQFLNLNVRGEFILMRLSSAIVLLLIIFAAFRVSPKKFKWTILAVSLIPMSIAAFGAISTDGFTIAASLLFMAAIASMVNKIQTSKLNNKDIIILATASILVTAAKVPIFLIILLILAITIVFWKKISKSHKISLFLIISISFIIMLLWANYAKDINTGAFWGKENINTADQIRYIVHHPLIFSRNIIFSMMNYDYINVPYLLYANGPFYKSMPLLVDIIIIIGLALSSFVARKGKVPTKEQIRIYWVQILIFIMMSAAIFTLLYLQFTPIGTPNAIHGVQPRYFIPLIPLLIMVPYTMKLSEKWRIFACIAPFIGVFTYLSLIVVQLI